MDPSFLRTGHCASAFDRMIWAFPFLLDPEIGLSKVAIDLLPDVVGWLIMASALDKLHELSPVVATLRTLSHWLIALSIFLLIEIRTGAGAWAWISWLLGFALVFLTLVLVWKLCGLIMDMAFELDNAGTWRRASVCRQVFLAYTLFMTLGILAASTIPPLMAPVLIVVLPAVIVIVFLLMGLMKQTAAMCRSA